MHWTKVLAASAVVAFIGARGTLAQNLPTPPFNQCVPVGADTGCAVLLVIDSNGSLRVATDPTQGPYDQIEDTLIGVQNNFTKTVTSIPLKGSDVIFGFDGDGICGIDPNTGLPFNPGPPACPYGPTTYEGPGVSFTNISPDLTSGTVNFSPGIPPGGSAYFSLELNIQTLCPANNNVPLLRQFVSPWNTDTYDHSYVTSQYATANSTPVSSTGTMELATFGAGAGQSTAGTTTTITLTKAQNNLNGLRDVINGLGVGVTASVQNSPNSGRPYLSLAATAPITAVQLRLTPGDGATNILDSIGAKGCWLTSAAMIINYHAAQQGVAFSTDPRTLNDYLNNQPDGYIGGNVNGTAVARYAQQNGVQITYGGRIDKRDDFTLDSYVCSGLPAMLKVGNPHFVVATNQGTASDGSPTYLINDPGYNNSPDLFTRYGNTYAGIRLFNSGALNPSGLYVAAHSPVELLVTDPNGNRTGLDPDTGTFYQDIPASSYGSDSIADDVDPATADPTPVVKTVEILTPVDGSFTVSIAGIGTGAYSLDFFGYDAAGNVSSSNITGTSKKGSHALYQVTYSSVVGSQITVAPLPNVVASPTLLKLKGTRLGFTSPARSVTLTNRGSAPATIGTPTASADFTVTNNCAPSLAPGDSCSLSITFTPTADGRRSGLLTVPGSTPVQVSLLGDGLPPVTLSTHNLSFGQVEVGGSRALSVILTNKQSVTLQITEVDVNGDFTQANNCDSSLPPSGSCTFTVTFSPSALRRRTGTLTVSDSAFGGTETVSLIGYGEK